MDCDYYARTGKFPEYGRREARICTEVTHNHPEGVKGALATTDAVFLCRYYFGGHHAEGEAQVDNDPAECKMRVREHVEKVYGYDLSKTLDEPLKAVLRRWENMIIPE